MNEKYQSIAARIRGPLAPILTPFSEADQVDHQSLASLIDWLANQHVPVMWTTGGTSEMMSLTEAEVFEITQTVARANAGRLFYIASPGPTWPVSKCIEFNHFAKDCGVDAVKVHINWLGKPTNQGIVDFYGKIAEATDLPLLAYTVGQPGMSVELLVKLIQSYPQFVGIKNDTDDEYRQTAYLESVPSGFNVITGGMMRPFFLGYHFGQRCYADVLTLFLPAVPLQFFSLLEAGKANEAIEQIKRYEMPWTELTFLGRHQFDAKATLKTILWLTGRFATNRVRFPRTSQPVDGQQVKVIRQFLRQIGVPLQR